MIGEQALAYALEAAEASRRASSSRSRHKAASALATAEAMLEAKELLPEIKRRYRFQDTPEALARRRRELGRP